MAAPKKVSPDRIVDAAMELAAERRWREVSLGDIAGAAGITLLQLHSAFRSKTAILGALIARIDEKILADDEAESADEPARERLLDVLMRRFEALRPYKSAVSSVIRDGGGNPAAALCAGARLSRSMSWCLESAGISSAGLAGRIRVKGLSGIYVSAFFVWLRDDSEDMGKTMAHLDRSLRRAERLMTGLPRPRSRDSFDEANATT